jgi:hypothetical protein
MLCVSGVAVAGTAHGLAVFDIVRLVPICVKCTLNPSGKYLPETFFLGTVKVKTDVL